jgi:hypothetical protein
MLNELKWRFATLLCLTRWTAKAGGLRPAVRRTLRDWDG